MGNFFKNFLYWFEAGIVIKQGDLRNWFASSYWTATTTEAIAHNIDIYIYIYISYIYIISIFKLCAVFKAVS